MIKYGFSLNFHDKLCDVFDQNGTKQMEVEMYGHSFPLKLNDVTAYHVHMDETFLWHKRYGHYNNETLRHMTVMQMVDSMPPLNLERKLCGVCEEGKSQRQPFQHNKRGEQQRSLSLSIQISVDI